MSKHLFLSTEWISEAKKIQETYKDRFSNLPKLRVNLCVTDSPLNQTEINAFFDSTNQFPQIDLGLLDKADITLTLTYEIAKSILVDGETDSAMKAFQQKTLKFKGNIFKLMSLSSIGSNPVSKQMTTELQAITR